MLNSRCAVALETRGEVATSPSWAERIAERYQLQAVARRWLCAKDADGNMSWQLLNGCHRLLHPDKSGSVGVQLLGNPANGHGVLAGLQTCGSPWTCPVCAGVIWDHRKAEISQALAIHRESAGAVLFITLTASHHHLPLEQLLDKTSAARRRVYTGGAFTRFKQRSGYLGAICATEITWSSGHGWHPHFHILWLLNSLSDSTVTEVRAYLETAWLAALQEQGLSASIAHGVVVKESSWDIAQYMAKIGHERKWDLDAELTMGTRKRGRSDAGLSAFELLRCGLVATSPRVSKASAQRLFQEYAKATKGHHSLRWSQGLREKLGVGMEESDEDVVTGEGEAEHKQLELDQVLIDFGRMPALEWRKILANDCRAELRIAVGKCDYQQLSSFLRSLDIEWQPRRPGATTHSAAGIGACPDETMRQKEDTGQQRSIPWRYPTLEWSYPWYETS